MSPILQDVQADIILPDLKANNGKQVLQALATEIAVRTGQQAEVIYNELFAQEQKSASGIGGGVAIPHIQMDGISEPLMVLARLEHALDFHSADQQNVDLVFLLVSPEKDGAIHLRRLSRISRMLKDETFCSQLRGAKDAHAMRALMTIMPDAMQVAA